MVRLKASKDGWYQRRLPVGAISSNLQAVPASQTPGKNSPPRKGPREWFGAYRPISADRLPEGAAYIFCTCDRFAERGDCAHMGFAAHRLREFPTLVLARDAGYHSETALPSEGRPEAGQGGING